MMHNSQISIEFIALMAIGALMLIIFGSIASTQIKNISNEKELAMLKDMGFSIATELDLAARVHPGFQRKFSIPQDLDGRTFNISIQSNQMIITTKDYDYTTTVPPLEGELKLGKNVIMNIDGTICVNEGCTAFDSIPPDVDYTIPDNGAVNVLISEPIHAFFSEDMNSSSLSITIIGITGSTNYSDILYEGIFTPDWIDYNTTYTAIVFNTSTDLAGNPIEEYQWTFTTELDTYPPEDITDLNTTQITHSSIEWSWTNPSDFNFSEILINGTSYINTSSESVNLTGLEDNTAYTISIRTWDENKNAGNWVNETDSTAEITLIFADLWDMTADSGTPEVDFTSGLNSSGNSFGLSAGDDGWDKGYHTYDNGTVYFGGAQITDLVRFNPNATFSAGGIDRRLVNEGGTTERLEIEVAGSEDPDTGADNDMMSGSYGIEFEVTNKMYSLISSGGNATLSFAWWALDPQGMEHPPEAIWIKARIHNGSGAYYLGSNLDGDTNATDDEYIDATTDSTYEIHYAAQPSGASASGVEDISITDVFSGPGQYYLDFGGKASDYSINDEYLLAAFDNISVRFEK